MKKLGLKLHALVMLFLKWGWPLLLADAALEMARGYPDSAWREALNTAAFAWVVCAPVAPLTLLVDRRRREKTMAKLCGLREGDERERIVTGEAARATLLLALSLQVILLALSLTSVRIAWDTKAPPKAKHGILSVGMGFSSALHLDPFGTPSADAQKGFLSLGAVAPNPGETPIAGGFLLAPSAFPILLLMILAELLAFRAFATSRYSGDAP